MKSPQHCERFLRKDGTKNAKKRDGSPLLEITMTGFDWHLNSLI